MKNIDVSYVHPGIFTLLLLFLVSFTFSNCKSKTKANDDKVSNRSITNEVKIPFDSAFDTIVNGKQIKLFHLENDNGIKVAITNYGARIVSWLTPDKDGHFSDIVLGYDNIEAYLNDKMYLGCIVGRYANRIAKGRFEIDNNRYQLAINNSPNTLHGGDKGFDKVVWEAVQEGNKLSMTYVSADMEEGYPGELTIGVVYELTENNDLLMEYTAISNKKTIVNLTNHSYFNLTGNGSQSILDHLLFINGNAITPVDSTLIPDGSILYVEDTPFDFISSPQKIGQRINGDHHQLKNGNGYDHNWVLNSNDQQFTLAASISEPVSQRKIEIYTTAPGIQFYSGNFMDGSVVGKRNETYNYRCGIALEPQLFPDSPNQASFQSPLINPGETYSHKCIYRIIIPQ